MSVFPAVSYWLLLLFRLLVLFLKMSSFLSLFRLFLSLFLLFFCIFCIFVFEIQCGWVLCHIGTLF